MHEEKLNPSKKNLFFVAIDQISHKKYQYIFLQPLDLC